MALGWFGTPASVGDFSAGLRFLTALRIIPGAMLNTLVPEFSSSRNKKNYMILFIIPLVIGIIPSLLLWWFAEPLIKFTFGFKNAVDTLRIVAWTFPFTILNHTLEAELLSRGKEGLINIGLIISLFVILTIAFLMIPNSFAIGAAYAALIGESLLTFVYFGFFIVGKKKP